MVTSPHATSVYVVRLCAELQFALRSENSRIRNLCRSIVQTDFIEQFDKINKIENENRNKNKNLFKSKFFLSNILHAIR